LFAAVVWTRDEPDDLAAHDNPSTTAMATRPISASDIRYAVMLPSSLMVRHGRARPGHPRLSSSMHRQDVDARVIPDQVGDRRPGMTTMVLADVK
jgi:hypothetical protein